MCIWISNVAIVHIGVGSGVVCSTGLGNARASVRGIDNKRSHVFFMSMTEFCLELG